jgi:hypothetical protein
MSSVWSSILQSLAWSLPYLATLAAGIVLSLARWRRHPAVSALLVAALGGAMVSSIGYRIAAPVIFAARGSTPESTIALHFGLLSILAAMFRTACWAALIPAIFGWRTTSDGRASAPLQFSIRGLIVVTFVVAVLCGLGRSLVGLLGEAGSLLVQIIDDLPLVACLGLGIWISVARWPRHPPVSCLAIWSFVLAMAVSLIPQLLMIAAIQSRMYPAKFIMLVNVLALLGSATSWALAIVAALGWRLPEPQATMPIDHVPLHRWGDDHARHPGRPDR